MMHQHPQNKLLIGSFAKFCLANNNFPTNARMSITKTTYKQYKYYVFKLDKCHKVQK